MRPEHAKSGSGILPRRLLVVIAMLASASFAWSAPKNEMGVQVLLRPGPSIECHGRLIVVISVAPTPEPRFQVTVGVNAPQVFGIDIDTCPDSGLVSIGPRVLGYPARRLQDIPQGEYYVQAVFNRYKSFHPQGGPIIWLPSDEGEGQHWQVKPGNLYSAVERVVIRRSRPVLIRLTLDSVMPGVDQDAGGIDAFVDGVQITPPKPEEEAKWIRKVSIRSSLLSDFWKRDIVISAVVLLPAGWAAHPGSRYPLVVEQDHFHRNLYTPLSLVADPPDAATEGYDHLYAEYSYKFFEEWSKGKGPHVLLICLQHPNPYYDDSYSVNSENLGPYGDALTQELIPEIERQFRGIGQPWARTTYGASTGGWAALASKVFYPDFYDAAWSLCPDPISFHSLVSVDLYSDKNMYFSEGPFGRTARSALRDANGYTTQSMEEINRLEAVLGSRGRSTRQFDAWQAVFSPRGKDGYPKPLFDKTSGTIDSSTAKYWEEHYDLVAKIEREWPAHGNQWTGKLHFTAGEMDTLYLNVAVHFAESRLARLKDPPAAASFDYGPGKQHCFMGEPDLPIELSRLRATQRLIPKLIQQMLKDAPEGADVSSWKY